ncbi:hypothetical protein A2118_01620 [Candidatus Kaiserbacteria bacterium GWA2_50_9]|uniref:Uncharacterized protein n=1 Tax=Candidatus Kaiserbacteria bacterium GWA2_50_9 TaxID=1798474 RepID=A0A1F6BVJ9_9BACT|nr:MAG: hypothetical protein A2118_01620 [Candidatus Kaiserbacteria bacterium GWA2_50_9]
MNKSLFVVLFAVLFGVAGGAVQAHDRYYRPVFWSIWYPQMYYPAPIIIPQPPVYIETRPAPQQYWYYCGSSRTYFPYVQTCPEGWMRVVPQAPSQ